MAKYSDEFKLMIVKEYLEGPLGYQLLAQKYEMPNKSSMIAIWHALFLKEGIEGLEPKTKGRPSMSKETKSNQPKKEKEIDREELLEREIELLRLEVSYLKKLKAFQENPDAYLEKHKQRWHLNSSKKDLN